MHRRLTVLCSGIALGFASAFAPHAASAAGFNVQRAFDPRGAMLAPSDRGIAADVAHARNLRDLGRMRADKPVDIGLLMRVNHLAELQQLTLMQGQPKSPYHHRYLTSAQWNAYFAPDAQTYARTAQTLARRGFRITKLFSNRSFIEARGTAAMAERYFSTELHSVYQPGYGVRYRNVTPAVMPAELRNVAVSVAGLHSIVVVRHPIHFADKNLVRRSKEFAAALSRVRAAQMRRPFNVPTPLGTATPSAKQPGPDPTLSPGDPSTDYTNSIGGYDPTIFAAAYDYPVYHGYGGGGRSVGTVIEADYLATDRALQYSNFNIPHTGIIEPVQCADAMAPDATCDNTIGQPDPVGESTLDALTIQSMAPAANFYEVIGPALDDIELEAAYEILVSENKVDDVNSSFGACETDDPAFGYGTNYIAMEGAALGITFEASTGDTGATTCGTYGTNGAPQTEYNTSVPSSGYYFTAIGGTMFTVIASCAGIGNGTATSPCYTAENAWITGGGGASVIEPIQAWQLPAVIDQPATSVGSTTMRNTPDMSFMAAFTPPDAGVDVYDGGNQAAIGGTSVGSPMFTALQVEINEVQGSRNGWVNPGLYAAFLATNVYTAALSTTNYAFRDVTTGNNDKYTAIGGYDSATGLGSPLGWELAGVENGTPVATPSPAPTPTPTPTASPASAASPAFAHRR